MPRQVESRYYDDLHACLVCGAIYETLRTCQVHEAKCDEA